MSTKKNSYVRICPYCASIDVDIDFSNPVVWADGTTVKYQCRTCKNIGNFFPEVMFSKVDDYKADLEKDKELGIVKPQNPSLIDGTTGENAMFTYFLGILILFGIILILIGLFSDMSFILKIIIICSSFILFIITYFLDKEIKKELQKK